MITRPASRSHICLSCRQSLTKRQLPLASQVARQSTDSSLHHISQRASAEQPKDNSAPVGNGNVIRKAIGPGPIVSPYPLGRLHGYRGVKLRESLENLKTTSLGEDAKVIVLRDSGYSIYNHEDDRLKTQEAEHIDILVQLDHERGLIGQDEVNENINACRPKPGEEPRAWDEINLLVRRLQTGFTILQLERYIAGFERREKLETPPAERFTYEGKAALLRITPWQRGVSSITDHFDDDPLRGYFLQSHTAKQRVILRLLRECWKLELPELELGIGQFEIEVHHDDLGALLAGPSSALKSIHREHLVHDDENLEVFLSRSVIRVTTPRFRKNLIVQAIEDLLKGVERRRLALRDLYPASLGKPSSEELDRWVHRNFDDAALQELGRLTSTSISRESEHKILISSLGNKPDALSPKNDTAIRLLLASGNISDRVVYQLAYHQPNIKSAALIGYPSIEGLPWRERLRQWTRWTSPISKEKYEFNILNLKRPPSVLIKEPAPSQSNPASIMTSTWKPNNTGDELAYWASDLHTETSALVGSVIHSSVAKPFTQVRPTPPEKLAQEYFLHSFSTHVPSLSRVLSKASLLEQSNYSQQVVLRFQPNPFFTPKDKGKMTNDSIGAAALSAFPPIEMILDIGEDDVKTAKLRYAQAIVSESKTDVMLPNNAVDLRFQQRVTTRLNRKYTDQVREFLEKSQLSLNGIRSLETPPSITFPISKSICRKPGFKILDGDHPRANISQPDKDFREVSYLFMGLEVQRTLEFEYEGMRLLYTSIEAGRAGGRRGELRLRPSIDDQMKKEEDFVEMAYNLAHILGSGSEHDYAPKQIRRLKPSNKKLPLVRRLLTKNSRADKLFKYFVMRPLEFSGQEGA